LLDADGEEVELNVVFEDNCLIEGSVDGKTEKITTLRLNVENEGGSGIDVNRLAQVDGVAFSVRVDSRNAEGDVAITADQYVAFKLWVEIDGGITLDIKDFIESNQ
jgi:hypothetical protein